MDREISKEVRQKEQRKQFIKLGAGIGIAVVLIGGVSDRFHANQPATEGLGFFNGR